MSDTPITPTVEIEIETPPAGYVAQAEIDRIVTERVQRERNKYADYNDLKAAAAKLAELEAANQSELERATAAATKAADELASWKQKAQQQTVAASLTAAAAKAGAVDPAIIVQLLASQVELDEDGNITSDLDAAVTDYLTAHPYMQGKPGTPAAPPAIPGTSTPPATPGASATEAARTSVNDLAKEENKDLLKALIEARNKQGAGA